MKASALKARLTSDSGSFNFERNSDIVEVGSGVFVSELEDIDRPDLTEKLDLLRKKLDSINPDDSTK